MKLNKLLIIILFLSFIKVIAFSKAEKSSDFDDRYPDKSLYLDANKKKYFPNKAFDNFVYSWYSKQLSALKEPSIYSQRKDRNRIIFRFTWLRNFYNPIAIRLEVQPDSNGLLFIKMTSGKGGYDSGKIKLSKKMIISKKIVSDFLKMIKNENFWKLPNEREDSFDGSQWIIEGLSNSNYHIAYKCSPENGSVRKIGVFLLRLSKLKVIY